MEPQEATMLVMSIIAATAIAGAIYLVFFAKKELFMKGKSIDSKNTSKFRTRKTLFLFYQLGTALASFMLSAFFLEKIENFKFSGTPATTYNQADSMGMVVLIALVSLWVWIAVDIYANRNGKVAMPNIVHHLLWATGWILLFC